MQLAAPTSRLSGGLTHLNAGLIAASTLAAGRELTMILGIVSREVQRWRVHAERIPDVSLRAQALDSLKRKRLNTDGAALLATLPRARSVTLVRLLVSYEILGDFLDTTNECAAERGLANGLQLNQALYDALDRSAAPADYYRHHLWTHDGGYLQSLVDATREACVRLPSFDTAAPHIDRASRLVVESQALNHLTDQRERHLALKAMAETQFPGQTELLWFEWTAAGSAWITNVALLSLSADPDLTRDQARETADVYLPWVSLAATLLDSYCDVAEDAVSGNQSMVSLYGSLDEAADRIIEVLDISMQRASALDRGQQHLVIIAAMVAMYLSKDGARTAGMDAETRRIVRSCGSLSRRLLPGLRGWRMIHGLESA